MPAGVDMLVVAMLPFVGGIILGVVVVVMVVLIATGSAGVMSSS